MGPPTDSPCSLVHRTNTNVINALFDQSGNFSIASGTVQISDYGTKNAGQFDVAAGATLTFTGAVTHNLLAKSVMTVAGTLKVWNGTVAVQSGAVLDVSGTTLISGNLLDLQAGSILTNIGHYFNITSGTADFHDANINATVLDIAGTLRTTQNLTASTGFYLRDTGLQISGTVNVNCPGYVLGGTHSVSGQFLANEDFTLSAGTLTGTAPLIASKRFYWLGGVLYNLVSGVQCLNGLTIDSAATKQITLTTLNNFAVRSLLLQPSTPAQGYLHSLSLSLCVWHRTLCGLPAALPVRARPSSTRPRVPPSRSTLPRPTAS